MVTEQDFLNAISESDRIEEWMIYADWLEERVYPRAEFLRLLLGTKYLAPDHSARMRIDTRLSELRVEMPDDWLAIVEANPQSNELHGRTSCGCYHESQLLNGGLQLHFEPQDTTCLEWLSLLDEIEQAADQQLEEFSPLGKFSQVQRDKIVTLPPTISKLKSVKHLQLYGTSLTRIPPEIGEMSSLEVFTPYTSYPLHWFPYEITKCRKLKDSTVSTRAIYGMHPDSFPKLRPWELSFGNQSQAIELLKSYWQIPCSRKCSVCDEEFLDEQKHRVWISLNVATDVLPLLVNACSQTCIDNLPEPSRQFPHKKPHRG